MGGAGPSTTDFLAIFILAGVVRFLSGARPVCTRLGGVWLGWLVVGYATVCTVHTLCTITCL